jgi:hypothetical protein
MKNLFKLLGIISLVLIIGFSMAACSSGGGDDGGSIDSALVGTWKGDAANGTLVIGDDGAFSSPDDSSDAKSFVAMIATVKDAGVGDLTIEDGKFTVGGEVVVFTYKIEDKTLTITDGDPEVAALPYFKGDKQ